MTRSAAEALAHVAEEARNPTLPAELGWCLKYCRIQYDIPPKYSTAYLSGVHADPQPGAPPAGAAIYWRNADWQTGTAGHIAIAAGSGQCWTTDLTADGGRDPGRFHLVPVDLIRQRWGLVLMGWSWTVNDVHIPHGDDELGGEQEPLDWLDMATADEVRAIVREEIERVVGPLDSWVKEALGSTAGWPDGTPEDGRNVRASIRWANDLGGQARTALARVAKATGVDLSDLPAPWQQ